MGRGRIGGGGGLAALCPSGLKVSGMTAPGPQKQELMRYVFPLVWAQLLSIRRAFACPDLTAWIATVLRTTDTTHETL